MSLNFQIDSNIQTIIDEFGADFTSKEIRAELANSINRASTQVKALLRESVSKTYNLKRSMFNKAYVYQRADGRKDIVQGIIRISGKPLPMYAFIQGSQKKGIRVYIKEASILEDSFIPILKSGHKGIFRRQGDKVVPGKGRWAGKMHVRGALKGTPILRQQIKERFTSTMANYVFSDSLRSMPNVSLIIANQLRQGLDKKLVKRTKT